MTSVSQAICDRLLAWKIARIYGYPGDGINGVLGALNERSDSIDFIQVRHEEAAAFMAGTHARLNPGELGVCLATSGPGAIHLLNGLYDAKMDQQPVLAIVGQTWTRVRGADFQQEVDLAQLFSDVASAYCEEITSPLQVNHVIDRAIRTAISERTVTAIILPADVQEMKAAEQKPGTTHVTYSGVGYSPPVVVPQQADLLRAAECLNNGSRVAILVGQGARGAGPLVEQVAERLGAGVAKALLAKDVIADDFELCTGSIGMLGTRASYEIMKGCDTLLIIGSSFPYADHLPDPDQAKCVQIDIRPAAIGVRYPPTVPLCGDAGPTLAALLRELKARESNPWRDKVISWIADWRKVAAIREEPEDRDTGMRPQGVVAALARNLPDNVVVCVDTGTATLWSAQHMPMRSGMRYLVSGSLASMGFSMPAGVSAILDDPTRPVVVLTGDGALQMNGLNEMLTIARYRDRLPENCSFVVVVLVNDDLNMVTWEQRAMNGNAKFRASQELPSFDYAAYAKLAGFRSSTVNKVDELPGALADAFGQGPTLIAMRVDPEEAPIPPHVSFDQFVKLTRSTTQDEQALVGALKGFRSKVEETFGSAKE